MQHETMIRLEAICNQAAGLAGLANTVSAAADTSGIDQRALVGIATAADRLADDLEQLAAELQASCNK